MAPPLTKKQKLFLEDYVFKNKNYHGRDRLWKSISLNHPDIKLSRRQINNWLQESEVHQLFRGRRKTIHIAPTILTRTYAQIAIDLIDMRNQEFDGYKWVLTAVDMFSRYSWVAPLKRKTSNKDDPQVVNGMKKILEKMLPQKPTALRSDNGSEFVSADFQKLLKDRGIRHQFSSAYTPASNGLVEVFNGKLKRSIMMTITKDDDNDWVSYIQKINDNLNNTYHTTIKMSPKELHETTNVEVRKTGQKNIVSTANKYGRIEKQKFNINDIVRRRRKEYDPTNYSRDLFIIKSVSAARKIGGRTTYRVAKFLNKHPIKLHKNNIGETLKTKYYNTDLTKIPKVKYKVKMPPKFYLSQIYTPIFQNGEKYLEVKFKNMPKSIEPYENIKKDAPKMLATFEKKFKVKWRNDRVDWSMNQVVPRQRKADVEKAEKKAKEIAKKKKPKYTRNPAPNWAFKYSKKQQNIISPDDYNQFVENNQRDPYDIEINDWFFYIWTFPEKRRSKEYSAVFIVKALEEPDRENASIAIPKSKKSYPIDLAVKFTPARWEALKKLV